MRVAGVWLVARAQQQALPVAVLTAVPGESCAPNTALPSLSSETVSRHVLLVGRLAQCPARKAFRHPMAILVLSVGSGLCGGAGESVYVP